MQNIVTRSWSGFARLDGWFGCRWIDRNCGPLFFLFYVVLVLFVSSYFYCSLSSCSLFSCCLLFCVSFFFSFFFFVFFLLFFICYLFFIFLGLSMLSSASLTSASLSSAFCCLPYSSSSSYCHRFHYFLLPSFQSGRQRGSKKPAIEDVITAKTSIFAPSMFSATLDEVMTMQASRFPDRKLPWIQTTLSEQVSWLTMAFWNSSFSSNRTLSR